MNNRQKKASPEKTGMIDPSPRRTLRQRPRTRMNLRVLLLVICVLAIWMGAFIRNVKLQREAVAAIHRAGGSVHYDAVYDIGNGLQRTVWAPRWLTDSLGIDFCSSVDMVSYNKTGADELATYLTRLTKLHTVNFSESDLSDSGLSHLGGLDLQRLILSSTKATDASIHHFHGMNTLDYLDLDKTSVGDAGMAELATLPRLSFLTVSDTQVGDQGVGSIVKLPALVSLNLAGTQVGDSGALLLKSLPRLRRLQIDRSQVTHAMMKQLYPSSYGTTTSQGG